MNTTTNEAELIFKPKPEQVGPTDGWREYQKEQQALRDNFHRLRAERLAREAAKENKC
jgi:hypothetical protein